MGPGASNLLVLVTGVITSVIAIATTFFWMYVAWRVMRAHERLADAAERQTDHRDHSA